jgi:predicted NAD/FAD-binding protein
MRIAIVGTGIAGLTAAHHLRREHEITVFERHGQAGGHANTIVVDDGGRELGLDTGFLVYNERTYPNFTRLLRELNVATQPSEMSFSVHCTACATEYSSRGLGGVFARRDQLLRPSFHHMLGEIARFNRRARAALAAGRLTGTLGDFLREHRFSRELVRHYAAPMVGAIWSSTTASAAGMPLSLFLRFFAHHGLLSVRGQPQWRTITGGSHRYVQTLTAGFRDRIRLRTPVRQVRRLRDGIELRTAGTVERFDKVVVAAHADEALALLADPSDAERGVLATLCYQENEAVVHTDRSVLPRSRRAWASWNYHTDDCARTGEPVRMTYHLNRLQHFSAAADYCVTLNDSGRIAADRIIHRIRYAHPCYGADTPAAQRRLQELNGERHTYYCGAYLANGFHEDGVVAGLAVVRSLAAARQAA